MSLTGCQINPIDVNFHLQKSLEIFDKNSACKIWSKNDKEIKVSPFMPIRVKSTAIKVIYPKYYILSNESLGLLFCTVISNLRNRGLFQNLEVWISGSGNPDFL